MAGEAGRQTAHLKEQLLKEGNRFSFIQVVRFLLYLLGREDGSGKDADDLLRRIRTRPELSLSFPEADVMSVSQLPDSPTRFSITATFLGLYGAGSPLPTFYTEDLLQEQVQDGSVSRDFVDIINSRLYSLYFAVWRHYRLFYEIGESKDRETLHRLYCLLGFEGPILREGLDDAYGLLRYAGLFNQFPRSAEGLRALLSDCLGAPVEIEQAVERLASISKSQRCFLGTHGNILGRTAYLGSEIADRMGKFRVHIGPLPADSFERLLPDKPLYKKMCNLIRCYTDQPLIWDADILLDRADLDVARLGTGSWSQLGFNTWIYSGSAPEDAACGLRCGA